MISSWADRERELLRNTVAVFGLLVVVLEVLVVTVVDSTSSQSCWKWVDRDPPWMTDAQSRPSGTKGCHQFLLQDDETDDIKPFVYIQDAKTLILVVVYWSVLRARSWRFSLSLQNQVLGVSYIFETILRKVLRCGANSSDEFVLAVKFQLAYSIIRFAPTSHSFIARFGQFEILVRIVLWIHFPCHIVDHICEAKGFPPQIFYFWKTKGFERAANTCPICSNISNTNSDTCFQTTFQGNFDLKLLTLYWLIVPWPPVTFTFTFPFPFPFPFSQTHFHLFAF